MKRSILWLVVVPMLFAQETILLRPQDKVDAAVGPEKTEERGKGGVVDRSVTNVSQPSLTVYLPVREKANGTAMVVCPGGGYSHLAIDKEGHDVARWLAGRGIVGIVLKYRLPGGMPPGNSASSLAQVAERIHVALEDAEEAIRVTRAHAAEWHLKTDAVGMMGFSAGGHLAAVLGMVAPPEARPNFLVLGYPAIPPALAVNEQTPRTFLVAADDDTTVNAANNAGRFYAALKAAKVPAELHIYSSGGHGFGIRKTDKTSAAWPEALEAWLKESGWGSATAQSAQLPKEVAGIPVNYDEAQVGDYILPDALRMANGKRVKDAKTWYKQRRPEIVRLFEENQFGRSPEAATPPTGLSYDRFDAGTPAFDGAAIRKQTTIYFSSDKGAGKPKVNVLVYLPAKAEKPVPVLLNIGFSSNAVVVANDPGVAEGEVWNRDHQKVPGKQGMAFGKIDVLPLIQAGFGFASIYYGDIEPDFEGGLPYGVRALFLKPGQTQPAADEWGAVAAWGWGLSRVLDFLEKEPGIDGKRVALYGASRLGKTVLWAAARDTRFAAVIACCSGEGGAALSRRNYGETIAHLTAPSRFPYQFAANYGKYAQNVNEFPVDANLLVSLIAPRPLLLQTGDTDYWSDPKGEYLAAKAASQVYELLGKQGLAASQWPKAGEPVMGTLSYYMHAGGHGTMPGDWAQFLKFLKVQLGDQR